MLIGYARTSTVEQVAGLEAQHAALGATGCNKVFSEQASSVAQRGGLTTKIHVVADAQGLPIRLRLTAGQAHDGQVADELLNHLGLQ